MKRRDGTVPRWPWFVIGGADPAAPAALRAYATEAENIGMDPRYVEDVRGLAEEFKEWREDHGDGDPDAPRHRRDDPATVAQMRRGRGS